MSDFTITPQVDETREFLEIANDFANPLDLVREAISNSYDANAVSLRLIFDTVQEFGESVLRITIEDEGDGMNKEELQAFFDLGNSINRDREGTIGEKGHGTKVYFNSRQIKVETVKNGTKLRATLDDPFRELHKGRIPEVEAQRSQAKDEESRTKIVIKGYHRDRRRHFTHERLKDHIYWFTKFGSVEWVFDDVDTPSMSLDLKGLDRDEPERLEFGHPFPDESGDVEELLDEYGYRAPGYYCRRHVYEGNLSEHPEVEFRAVFSIEGKNVKYDYNDMLRRRGYTPPEGAYTVRERYGLWLCKDCIPVQRKNIWITEKGRGFEFTRFHAFVNCQALKLTANRGSVDNSPPEIIDDLKNRVREIHADIVGGEEWSQLEWLEEAIEADRTIEQEKEDFSTRRERAKHADVCVYKGTELVEPHRESGVYGLLVQLETLEPELFPFEIVSYDTHSGIDLLVKSRRDDEAIAEADLYYVELKYVLADKQYNHSFRHTHSIVCWDTELRDGDIIEDIREEERKLEVTDDGEIGYTRYLLDWPGRRRKIEVFVLKDYLREKIGVDFRPRTEGV